MAHRMVFNSKKFNESVEYEHFKMDNLSAATQIMTHRCFMVSVDLPHALSLCFHSTRIQKVFEVQVERSTLCLVHLLCKWPMKLLLSLHKTVEASVRPP